MSAITMASICSVMLATGAIKCAEPVKFDEARRDIERRSVAQAEFFDPRVDRYYYLTPIETPPRYAPDAEPDDPLWRYRRPSHPMPSSRTVLRGTMEPVR